MCWCWCILFELSEKFRNIGKTIKNNTAHFCRSNRWRCWHTAEQDFYIAVMPHSQSWIQWLGQGQSWISSIEAQKQYWKKLRWMNHRNLIDFMAFWCDFNDCNGILMGFNDQEGILVIESGSYSLSTHFHKNVPQYSCMLIWLAPRMHVERGDRPTFFDHSFHRTSNQIDTTCIIGHFTHFVGCWNSPNITKGNWRFAWWRTWVQSLGHTHFFQKKWARQSWQFSHNSRTRWWLRQWSIRMSPKPSTFW